MTPTNAELIAGARDHALTAGTRESAVDPDREARDHLQALAQMNPAIGTCEGLLAVTTTAVVPLDRDSLAPTAEAFGGFSAAVDHYQARPHDGCGLQLAAQKDGSVLVAVRTTQAAWNAWLGEHGTETRPRHDDDGRIVESHRSYIDPGRHLLVHWAPPRVQARASAVAVGRAMIEAEGERIRTDRAGVGEVGWVAWQIGAAWQVGGKDGSRLVFKSHSLGHGVDLLAEGVLPLAAHRRDGWSLTYTGTPIALDAADFPSWLVEAFGGRWTKVKP